MITKESLPNEYKLGDKAYRFTDEDKKQILEEGGFVEVGSIEAALRLDTPYHILRRSSIARRG